MTPHVRARAATGAASAAAARPADLGEQSDRVRIVRLGGRRGRSDDGAALVEFALLAPLIFMLIFGMITGGMALSYKNSMSNAAREGSRLGATLPAGDNWAPDVRTRVVDLASGDLSPGQVCVELTGSAPAVATGNAGGCESWNKPPTPVGADGCVVKVWARRTAELNVIIWTRDLILDVSSVARYEREGSGGC